MLHIVTPIYRPNLIQRIYDSIPKKEDIKWHISYIKSRESEVLITGTTEYPIIEKYSLDCEDKDTISKRNIPFSNIEDGYFCSLDDDTIFLDEMYNVYKELSSQNYVGMAVGTQIRKNGDKRLSPSLPIHGKIDTGNVIAHHSCLSNCKWKFDEKNNRLPKDYVFWNSVYHFYNKNCKLINNVISIYNKLR